MQAVWPLASGHTESSESSARKGTAATAGRRVPRIAKGPCALEIQQTQSARTAAASLGKSAAAAAARLRPLSAEPLFRTAVGPRRRTFAAALRRCTATATAEGWLLGGTASHRFTSPDQATLARSEGAHSPVGPRGSCKTRPRREPSCQRMSHSRAAAGPQGQSLRVFD